MTAWYVVYTRPRAEQWAHVNLRERGFEAYLPRYRKERRHARRVELVAMPLFPRYLFVEADLEAGDRRRIVSAPGVENLVAFGERSAALPPAVLAEIRAREDAEGYVAVAGAPPLRAGQAVRVAGGPFGDLQGLFECAADRDRVVVLLQMLGRSVRATIPAALLARSD